MIPLSGAALQLDVHRVVHCKGRHSPRTRSQFKGSVHFSSHTCSNEYARSCTTAASAAASGQATQDGLVNSWWSSFGGVYGRWKTVFAGLIGSCACTILACAALLGPSASNALHLQGVHQAWAQICAAAVPAILHTPAAQLYATLICAAIFCAYAVIVKVSAGQQLMPALGAADRHHAPWAPLRGTSDSDTQPSHYVHPGTETTTVADATSGPERKTTFPAQPLPLLQDNTEASDRKPAIIRSSSTGPRVPANTGTPPWPSAIVWPASSDTVADAHTASALATSLAAAPAAPSATPTATAAAAAAPSPAAAPPPQSVLPTAPPRIPAAPSGAALPESGPTTAGLEACSPAAAQDAALLREEVLALRRATLVSFGQAARRPSTPVAAPAALFGIAADAVTPGWQSSAVAAAAARAGVTAVESLALAASPFAPLFSLEGGPIAFQAPIVRSQYDPLVALLASAPPTQRHAWDPMSSLRTAEAPTHAAHGRPALDPLTHMARACAPTGGAAWDPLQRLRSAAAPTRAMHTPSALDPLSHIALARAPTGGSTWDPLQRLRGAAPPSRRTMGKSILDPLSHISAVQAPQGGKAWDPVHALVNASAPRGGGSWDPMAAAVRARVPKHRAVWDPVHMLQAQAPTGRTMLDPVHALTRMDVPRTPSRMDPMSSFRKMSQPSGMPKWDPLRLLREARQGKASSSATAMA
eukprot:jgi/Ulvmu1/4111/UM019_0090.1